MSEEMRSKTRGWKRSPGRLEGSRPVAIAAAARVPSVRRRLAWAARFVKRLAPGSVGRAFPKAQLTDLASPGTNRRETRTLAALACYDQRRYFRKEFRTALLQQQFVTHPMVAIHTRSEASPRTRRSSPASSAAPSFSRLLAPVFA